MSITWFTHQDCKDMFLLSKWNQTKTYDYAIERDFGTDYGICCWYTPQLNFTQIDLHTHENHLHEPDWGHWFMNVPKVLENKIHRVHKKKEPCLKAYYLPQILLKIHV